MSKSETLNKRGYKGMYEYELLNKLTNETIIVFGYFLSEVWGKYKLNEQEWEVLSREYID